MNRLLPLTLALASASLLPAQGVILDFETEETSTTYGYFGYVDVPAPAPATAIPNPDPTGVNTSANVLEFKELPGGEPWAGGFPDPAREVDLTVANQVCMDVWMPELTTVALKLEGATPEEPFWVNNAANATTNAWEQICWNVSVPSIQGDLGPGTGRSFAKATLFVGLDETVEEEMTYYFDNMITEVAEVETADVTFAVDMNAYEGEFTTAFVAGQFNEWSADANPLADDDGDGVWTGTVTMLPGTYQYKFQLDGWTVQDEFDGSEACTVTEDGFTNRVDAFTEDVTLEPVCFNSCYACGTETVEITFDLGANGITVSEEGLYLAGGAEFGAPGRFRLTDDDLDGNYALTITRPVGFSSFYTFTNGACADFGCKEDLTGQACGDPANFSDRFLPPVQQDTTLSTCFGNCETDLAACGTPPATYALTVSVDMTDLGGDFTQPYVYGSFNGWDNTADALADDDGDGVWTTTLTLLAGRYEYKFAVDGQSDETLESGSACTVTAGDQGQFVNRVIDLSEDTDVGTVCYASCDACASSSLSELSALGVDFAVAPTVADDEVRVDFGATLATATLRLFDLTGKSVRTIHLRDASRYALDVAGLTAGYYLLELDYVGARGVRRVVKR